MSSATIARRLENARAAGTPLGGGPAAFTRARSDLARRLASAVGGSVISSVGGTVVRCEGLPQSIPIDRDRLATLPGQPPASARLICLDTETTGLGTAAGTVAFLVGLGWWEGDAFRQVQFLLPDHPDEPALLDAIAALIPDDAWLVTYNGRSFDWPLLVARYRLARREPPRPTGHLDLLPVVRRLFRHRTGDARLKTVETMLLGVQRHEDVDGWQIPGLYLDFLRGESADPIADIVRHNDEDVRSLARLLGLLEASYADPVVRRRAPDGDLAGLARSFRREKRLDEALDCLEAVVARPRPAASRPVLRWDDHGVRIVHAGHSTADRDRIESERASLLRRLGRHGEALAAWRSISARGGIVGIRADVEIAKIHEHVDRDPHAALEAADRAARRLEMIPPTMVREMLKAQVRTRSVRLVRRCNAPSRHVGLQAAL